MDFVFQEFQSTLPLWLYVLLISATTLLSWWSYRSIQSVSPAYKYCLIALRSLTFFVLAVLLLNPVFRTEQTYYEKPDIIVLLDNSESISIEKGDYRGMETYQSVLDRLNLDDTSSVSFTFFGVGEHTHPLAPAELNLRSDRTNLNSAVETVLRQQRNSNAAVLISDGIYTGGQNPVFDGRNLDIPLFTIALGDTASERDLVVNAVSANNTGYVDTEHPVSVTITARGFENRPFPVQIMRSGTVLDSRTVTPGNDSFSTEIEFDLPLEEEGLQQYQIVIPPQDGEWTGSNNSRLFSIDVQEARQRILSVAFEIHPDVRFIRSLLLGDSNTSLTNRTWLKGSQFIEGPLEIDPDTVDLAVVHGFPASGLPPDVEQTIRELSEHRPVLIAALPLFSGRNLEAVSSAPLPVDVSRPPEYGRVTLSSAVGQDQHPVMELPAIDYNRLPPLMAPIRNLTPVPGSVTLFNSDYRDESTDVPLVSILEAGNRRLSYVAGYGWYRAAQHTDEEVRNFVSGLWWNLMSWTATPPDNRRLGIEPSKSSYSGSESIIIHGSLRNESGEMEPDADIDIELSSDTMETRFYSMENRGNGRYRLELESMPEGMYRFRAVARKGDRTIGEQSGEFAVARSNVEFINTTRNDRLLRQLAEQSGGRFFTHDSLDGFWDTFRERGLLEQQEKVNTTLFYPYRHWGWFVLVILLLTAEWILRKLVSLP